MKIYALKYEGKTFLKSFNIGDDIQSIAAARLLPRIDGFLSRDHLSQVTSPCIVSMNGFFMGEPNWPPSEFVIPIFYAFHIAPAWEKTICSLEGVSYLRQHQPIGCRDRGTVEILKKHDIQAYFSGCLTLTLDRRKSPPNSGQVFISGGANKGFSNLIPEEIRREAFFVNQGKVQLPFMPATTRQDIAQHLLDAYRDHAKLVITSKIHCAMPCIAMGIPVVFLANKNKRSDYRIQVVGDFIPINYVGESFVYRMFSRLLYRGAIDWQSS